MSFSRFPRDNDRVVAAKHRIADILERPSTQAHDTELLYAKLAEAGYVMPLFPPAIRAFRTDMLSFVSEPKGIRKLDPFY